MRVFNAPAGVKTSRWFDEGERRKLDTIYINLDTKGKPGYGAMVESKIGELLSLLYKLNLNTCPARLTGIAGQVTRPRAYCSLESSLNRGKVFVSSVTIFSN